jgi:hypothetical protein
MDGPPAGGAGHRNIGVDVVPYVEYAPTRSPFTCRNGGENPPGVFRQTNVTAGVNVQKWIVAQDSSDEFNQIISGIIRVGDGNDPLP